MSDDRPEPPKLIPFFPATGFSPGSLCPHHGPLPAGSLLCGMVCHKSGVDDHPALARDPRTDPRPERKPKPAPAAARRETRKERRRREFAHLAKAG
jgi:hypothetical protein